MRAFAFAASLFAAAAVATDIEARDGPCDENACPCMTMSQATQVANNFRDLIVAYSDAKANEYLTPDFVDYSDSVNELINNGCPTGPATLGQPTFANRAAFEAGQGSQPSIPFTINKVYHTCDAVFMRWESDMKPELVHGIVAMETTCEDSDSEPFKINTVYSEFNSGAWLVDLGIFNPTNCSAPPS